MTVYMRCMYVYMGWCRSSFWLPMHWAECVYIVLFGRYGSLKLPLSCKIMGKRWFLDADF